MARKEIIINRAEWEEGTDDGSLYNPDTEQFCVLGHVLKQAGVNKSVMAHKGEPEAVIDEETSPKGACWTIAEDNEALVQEMIAVNDDGAITRRERERTLKALFRQVGMKLKFFGRNPRRKGNHRDSLWCTCSQCQ